MGLSTAAPAEALDAALVDAVRARIAGGIALLCGVGVFPALYLISDPVFPARNNPGATIASILTFLAIAGWLLVRGERTSETEYLGLVTLSVVVTASWTIAVQAPGAPPGLEWALLSGILNGAVFARHRSGVALVVVVGIACMVLCAWQRLGVEGGAVVETVIVVLVTGFVVTAVRALREIAVGAIERANRGEVTDPLTGVSNRRGLERRGGRMWRDAGERQAPVSLLVVDIDHFKKINDTLGHAEGDRVIRETAALLEASLRPYDLVVRLGGEEFLVLLRGGRDEAVTVAERIRMRIAADLEPVTVSVGVTAAAPGADDALPSALWQAVDVADRALYVAKNSGRNQVALAT